jgi:hypothetical protein
MKLGNISTKQIKCLQMPTNAMISATIPMDSLTIPAISLTMTGADKCNTQSFSIKLPIFNLP